MIAGFAVIFAVIMAVIIALAVPGPARRWAAKAGREMFRPLADRGPAGRTSRLLLPSAILIPLVTGWLFYTGNQAGWWPPGAGIGLMAVTTGAIFAGLSWWASRAILAAETRYRRVEVDLARMAHHDFLTGLPNRARFMERLLERMEHHRRRLDSHNFVVIYMDLDNFKAVNAQLGQSAGDALLREVSLHLQRCARNRSDIVARMGGDEFAILLEHVRTGEEAAAVARRVVNGMPQKFGPPGQQVAIGMSVGIVAADLRHDSAEALLNDALSALADARRRGMGCFSVFSGLQPQRIAS